MNNKDEVTPLVMTILRFFIGVVIVYVIVELGVASFSYLTDVLGLTGAITLDVIVAANLLVACVRTNKG